MRRLCLDEILDPKRNNFALLRLIAAVCVVLSHAGYQLSGDPHGEILKPESVHSLGGHGVNIFFVVSGLLVSASLARSGSLLDFVLARALRIFPALIVCTLFLALVLGPIVTSEPLARYFGDIQIVRFVLLNVSTLSAMTPLPGVFTELPLWNHTNGPIWTLKYEIACYAALGALSLVAAWRTTRGFVLLAVVPAALGAIALVLKGGDPNAFSAFDNMLRFWLCFTIGMAMFRARSLLPIPAWPLLPLALLWWFSAGGRFECVVAPFAVAHGALLFARLPLPRLRQITNRMDLSYGVYIFGWPLTHLVIWMLPGLSLTGVQLLALALTFPVAALSWVLVEKPALKSRLYWLRAANSWLPRSSALP